MSDEGFLSRWSRRKRAADAGRPAEEAPATPAPTEVPAQPAAVEPTPEPAFDIASLPPVESLTLESDITAFLRKEVPEALKRAALRKAWSLDPAIRDFVGPADYAWDFNAPDGVPGFSLELGGDPAKLLAQAMGFDEPEEPPAPPSGADAPTAETPPAVEVADDAAEPAGPPPIAEAAADEPAVEPPDPAPRRHGSALPS